MTSKEKILEAVLKNQPQLTPLPNIDVFKGEERDKVEKYTSTFTGIGGKAFSVDSFDDIKVLVKENYDITKRIITTLPELQDIAELYLPVPDPHSFHDVELAIIQAQFSVAENGAVWLTEQLMGHRILPFICQHLAVIVYTKSIVPTMHEAYSIIGEGEYGFGSFIGGPSKTADIEQALVMGAHGPITMTVFVMK